METAATYQLTGAQTEALMRLVPALRRHRTLSLGRPDWERRLLAKAAYSYWLDCCALGIEHVAATVRSGFA